MTYKHNELLSVGTIHIANNKQIVIESKEQLYLKININDNVKLAITGEKSLVFISKVYLSNTSVLKLLNNKFLCIENSRKQLRVSANLKRIRR